MVVFADSKARDGVLYSKRVLRASTLARQALATTQIGLARPTSGPLSKPTGGFPTPDSSENIEFSTQKNSSPSGSLKSHTKRAGRPRLAGVFKQRQSGNLDDSSFSSRTSTMAHLGTLRGLEEPNLLAPTPPTLRETSAGVGLLGSLSPRLLPRSTTAGRSPSQMSAMVFFTNQQQQTTEFTEGYKLLAKRNFSDSPSLVEAMHAALAQSANILSPTSPTITESVSTPSSPTVERRNIGRARAASFNIRAGDENASQPLKDRPTLDDLIKQGYGEREMPGSMDHPMYTKKKTYVPTKS